MLSIYRIWDREPGSKIGAFLGPFLDCLKRINVLSAKKKKWLILTYFTFSQLWFDLCCTVSVRDVNEHRREVRRHLGSTIAWNTNYNMFEK